MPTYDYRCPNGHEFEVIHRMSDPPPAACEICGASPLERVFHPVPVFFKGSGFYSTDYGRKKRKVESSGDGDSSKSETKSSDKTADKPAEKSSTSSDT
ncbi:MAG TPA: zinc ribbon domain-containing protein [Gaiellaceae bacterium]|nr:zinc ribbon domain-containing protein [Gaiellaceae bacterium]